MDEIIGGYFLESVKEFGGCPCVVRGDYGTEMDLYVTFRICFGTIQLQIIHSHLTWTEAALETNVLKGGGALSADSAFILG